MQTLKRLFRELSRGLCSLNLPSSLDSKPTYPLKQLESCLWFDHKPDPKQLAELEEDERWT